MGQVPTSCDVEAMVFSNRSVYDAAPEEDPPNHYMIQCKDPELLQFRGYREIVRGQTEHRIAAGDRSHAIQDAGQGWDGIRPPSWPHKQGGTDGSCILLSRKKLA